MYSKTCLFFFATYVSVYVTQQKRGRVKSECIAIRHSTYAFFVGSFLRHTCSPTQTWKHPCICEEPDSFFNTFDWSSSLRISLVWYLTSNWFSTEFHSMGRNIFNSLDQLSWKPTYYRPSFLLPETTNLYRPVSKACYFSWVSTSLPIGPILLKITMIGLH